MKTFFFAVGIMLAFYMAMGASTMVGVNKFERQLAERTAAIDAATR